MSKPCDMCGLIDYDNLPVCPYCKGDQFALTPPKPKPTQTSFDPATFDDDGTGFKSS